MHASSLLPVFYLLCQNEQKPVLRVFNAVMRETLSVMGTVFLLSSSVARLKSMVSHLCGLPVSTFRLTTLGGVQLYDCNRLHDYAIEAGTACFLCFSVVDLCVCVIMF